MQRTKHQEQNPTHTSSWVKPPTGTTKGNVDATMFDNNTIMGYEMCFRNSLGQLLLGKSGFLLSFSTVLEAESIALLESIKTTISNGMHTVLFETDCKFLVDALTSPAVLISEFGNLVSQCRRLLSSNPDYVVSFVKRQANKVAHTIARASLSHPSLYTFNDVPSTMYYLFMNEMH